jgi:hypothetical protein
MLDENLGDVGDKGQNPIGITFCDSRYESSDEILRDAKNAQSLIQ